jgi:hypothetical protein
VFWVGQDGTVWTTFWDFSTGWNQKPYQINDRNTNPAVPAITSVVKRGSEQLNVFWVGRGNSVWTTFWPDDRGNWAPPKLIGGNAAGAGSITSVSRADQLLDVFWVGWDGSVWTTWPADDHGDWTPPEWIGDDAAITGGAISSVNRGPQHLDVFWVGEDGTVWTNYWDFSTGWNQKQYPIGGNAYAAVPASITSVVRGSDHDHLDVFWMGQDGTVWTNYWPADNHGDWGKPRPISPVPQITASVVLNQIGLDVNIAGVGFAPDADVDIWYWNVPGHPSPQQSAGRPWVGSDWTFTLTDRTYEDGFLVWCSDAQKSGVVSIIANDRTTDQTASTTVSARNWCGN